MLELLPKQRKRDKNRHPCSNAKCWTQVGLEDSSLWQVRQFKLTYNLHIKRTTKTRIQSGIMSATSYFYFDLKVQLWFWGRNFNH